MRKRTCAKIVYLAISHIVTFQLSAWQGKLFVRYGMRCIPASNTRPQKNITSLKNRPSRLSILAIFDYVITIVRVESCQSVRIGNLFYAQTFAQCVRDGQIIEKRILKSSNRVLNKKLISYTLLI